MMISDLEHLLQRKPERPGIVQPQEGRTEKGHNHCLYAYKYLIRCQVDRARLFFSCAQQQNKGQWAQTGTLEVPPEHGEKLLYSEVDSESSETGCPQMLCSYPSPKIFKTCLDDFLCNLLQESALVGGLD